AVCGVGLGAGKATAFRSLVAGSVHPLKQGKYTYVLFIEYTDISFDLYRRSSGSH
ncbi:hypothetical protein CPC08DRAFT_706372, partial [Agrocybe pediades]